MHRRVCSLALYALILLPLSLAAQVTTADLIGTVRDSSGALVAGAQVTVTNEATGVSRTALTDAAGNYLITQLPPGRYVLTAELAGFRKHVQSGLELQPCRYDTSKARALAWL